MTFKQLSRQSITSFETLQGGEFSVAHTPTALRFSLCVFLVTLDVVFIMEDTYLLKRELVEYLYYL